MQYDSAEDAQMRLMRTCFLYKGRGVYCHEVQTNAGGKLTLRLYPMPMNPAEKGPAQRFTVTIDDPELNYMDLSGIGYVNFGGTAVYIARRPGRQQAQGLKGENTQFYFPADYNGNHQIRWLEIMNNTDMFNPDYPTLDNAVALLGTPDKYFKEPTTHVAFSRTMAIGRDDFRKDFLLHYKGQRVAFGREIKQLTTNAEYSYLREVFAQHQVNVS